MAHKEDADEAVKDPNPTIDGRRANVNLAYMGAKNRAAALPGMLARANWNCSRRLIFSRCSRLQFTGSHARLSINSGRLSVCRLRIFLITIFRLRPKPLVGFETRLTVRVGEVSDRPCCFFLFG